MKLRDWTDQPSTGRWKLCYIRRTSLKTTEREREMEEGEKINLSETPQKHEAKEHLDRNKEIVCPKQVSRSC